MLQVVIYSSVKPSVAEWPGIPFLLMLMFSHIEHTKLSDK